MMFSVKYLFIAALAALAMAADSTSDAGGGGGDSTSEGGGGGDSTAAATSGTDGGGGATTTGGGGGESTGGGGDNGTEVTITKVVSELVTYCPEPTVFCLALICYTVDKPTMLTITDCPCTVTEVATLGPEGPGGPEPVATGAADSNQAAHGLAMAALAAAGYLAL